MNDTVEMTMFEKKAEDLTVGEALKINLGVAAVMAAVPVVIWGAAIGIDKINVWRANRKFNKLVEKELETV